MNRHGEPLLLPGFEPVRNARSMAGRNARTRRDLWR